LSEENGEVDNKKSTYFNTLLYLVSRAEGFSEGKPVAFCYLGANGDLVCQFAIPVSVLFDTVS